MKDPSLSPDLDKIELHPDAWERFKQAVKAGANRAPMPQAKKAPPKPKPSVVKRKA